MIIPARFQSIVVLTGAGISAESGIKTFRDNNGLWENHRLEDVATPEAFINNPTLVHRFYNARRQQLLAGVKPNAAHKALAEFAQKFSGSFTLVTQNVDNLHESAGSEVIHMHGELLKMRCCHSNKIFPCKKNITIDTPCPCCGETHRLRPHIVWFGEIPLAMDEIMAALSRCDLFIAIGTSGQVYPAAGFVELAKRSGARTLEINLASTATSPYFDTTLNGRASDIVPTTFLTGLDQNFL